MIDTFYIGAYWKNRKQLLCNVIDPTLQTLRELSAVDKQFHNLYELGESRQQASENEVLLSPEHIEKLYGKRLKSNDLDEDGYSKIGYRLSLWTGHTNDESSQISFAVGKSSERQTNLCLINLPAEGPARDRLLQLAKLKEIIKILVQSWNPDIIVLNSRELSNTLKVENEIGWVTYTKKLKGRLRLNDNVKHEDGFLGGHLFHLSPDNIYRYDLMHDLAALKQLI